MASATPVLCLLLVSLVGARRMEMEKVISRHEGSMGIFEGEEKPVQECIYSEPLVLECPEDRHVEVVTAFWNRRKRANCRGVENLPYGTGKDCNPNATDRVISFCESQGGNSCKLAAGTHGCKENPFTFMRVRWQCVEGVTLIEHPDLLEPKEDEAIKEEEEVIDEELMMEEEEYYEEEDFELPQAPKVKDEDEAKEWRKNALIRLMPTSLNWDVCRSLQVGAWGECEKVEKAGGLTSSPLFDGDSVCRCHYLAPFKNVTCDDHFYDHSSVHTVKREGMVAKFGYEGCDCNKNPQEKAWWNCDFAVREV